jgi:hypothetical protein
MTNRKPEETMSRPPFADPDGFYQALVEAHEGLDVEQSLLLNARLILLLIQHLGDEELARALLREAAQGVSPRGDAPTDG